MPKPKPLYVLCGGSWYDDTGYLRAANRIKNYSVNRHLINGLRCILKRDHNV